MWCISGLLGGAGAAEREPAGGGAQAATETGRDPAALRSRGPARETATGGSHH